MSFYKRRALLKYVNDGITNTITGLYIFAPLSYDTFNTGDGFYETTSHIMCDDAYVHYINKKRNSFHKPK